MGRFIFVTFGFLAWAFYEMSGGSDFEPAKTRVADIRTDPLKPAETRDTVANQADGLGAVIAEPLLPEPTAQVQPIGEQTPTEQNSEPTTTTLISLDLDAPADPTGAGASLAQLDGAGSLGTPLGNDLLDTTGAQTVLPSLIQTDADAGVALTSPLELEEVAPVSDNDGSAVQTSGSIAAVGNDFRTVSGNRVNLRGGPGTNFDVIVQLVRGDEVEILEDTGTGWVRLRVLYSGEVGWMADFLLSNG